MVGGEHRRGRSMGSTAARPETKDDDLALFHEMKCREKHNFLTTSVDDLDASLSSKFGVLGTPVKKSGGTDLLTSDADKNDYDWLLTPPGTPLFPSLDQEGSTAAVSPQPAHSASSSANKVKALNSPADPSPKSARGNPSPRRTGSTTPNGTMSRSRSTPHNSTSVVAAVARPSTPSSSATRPSTPTAKSSSTPSVRSSTPNLKLSISASKSSSSAASTPTGTRPSTPNARSSTPSGRPSTPGARSSTPTSKPSTPTMRRSLSGGKISSSPATTRGGPSPKRTTSSRGNSPAAKRVTSIITTVPGMCSEAPPNLRTTAPERASSTSKIGANGSRSVSDASDAMDASGRSRRRPRSPSVTRSFSSSSSQDQRTTSSQTSRGSVISSYDDGIEVNRPTLQSSRNGAVGKWHAAGHEDLLSGKANTNLQAKRVTKSLVIPSSSSGGTPTKKSLEPNKWQGEAYQHSPSSYRHLVSGSPGSPFYSARASSLIHRPASAMNSSVTTSSNASSEHGTTVAPDTEGSERDDDDILSWDSYGRRMSPSPRAPQADILTLDKEDGKMGAWQEYERLNGNGVVASYRSGTQTSLDTDVTSFYETDGMASYDMLEQFGLIGESYGAKKGSPGERFLERRASNIEDGKAELRRSVERTLQRRASNIEDSRIPDIRRSDEFSGLSRPTSKSDRGGQRAMSPGLKLKRQELLESLSDNRRLDGALHKESGGKTLGPQKSKVSPAEIHAACHFVRDFKVGLAPSQSHEPVPSVSHIPSGPADDAPSAKWAGNCDSVMNGKDRGGVRESQDVSQQKPNVLEGGEAFAQMGSTLLRRPQTGRKSVDLLSAIPLADDISTRIDALPLQEEEDGTGNDTALSVLVGVMERIKESSQPKLVDPGNQVSTRLTSADIVEDVSPRRLSSSQMAEIRTSLGYEEVHSMDVVGTPELHDIEEDTLMYDGGKDELDLLESLHRTSLRKGEARVTEEMINESPKRQLVLVEKVFDSSPRVDELPLSSTERTWVESSGDVHTPKRDVVSHGSPKFLHDDADVPVTSMDLNDFLRPGERKDLEPINGHTAALQLPDEVLLQCKDEDQLDQTILQKEKVVLLDAWKIEERQRDGSAAGTVTENSSLSSAKSQQEDSSILSLSSHGLRNPVVPKNILDLETHLLEIDGCPPLRCTQAEVVDTPDQSEFTYQVHEESRTIVLPELKGKVTIVAQSIAMTNNAADSPDEMDVPYEAARNSKKELTLSTNADGIPVQHRGEFAEESPNQMKPEEIVEEKLPDPDMEDSPSGTLGSRREPSTEINLESELRSTVQEDFAETEGGTDSEMVKCADIVVAEEILKDDISKANHEEVGETSPVTDGNESHLAPEQKYPVHLTDSDISLPMETTIPDDVELEGSQEHEAVVGESHEEDTIDIDESSSENGSFLGEEMGSTLGEDSPCLESPDPGNSVSDSVRGLRLLSKPEGLGSQDFFPGIMNSSSSRRQSLGDSNHLDNSDTGSSGDVEYFEQAASNYRNVSQVSRSLGASLENAYKPTARYQDAEEPRSLDYIDAMSLETSVYYEATSEEREDNEEVSSILFLEEKEAALISPRVLSRQQRDEDAYTGPSTLSEIRNARRNASSLCAALEVQLAGLIQKIDSAIEDSSKPLVSDQQEVVVVAGNDKPSASLESLQEEEAENRMGPVTSGQGEDLLEKLWAEDGRSKQSEGFDENERSQLGDSTSCCHDDDSLNQESGKIPHPQPNGNQATPLSDGHQPETPQNDHKAEHRSSAEEERYHTQSPKALAGNEAFEDVGDFAEAWAYRTEVQLFVENGKGLGDETGNFEQESRAESLPLKTRVPFGDVDEDKESCKETAVDNWVSSENETDPGEEDGDYDDISSGSTQAEEPLGSVWDESTLNSEGSVTVSGRAAGGDEDKVEHQACTVDELETFLVKDNSSAVQHFDGYGGPDSAGGGKQVEVDETEERTQHVQASSAADLAEHDAAGPTEEDVESVEFSGSENLHSADATAGTESREVVNQDYSGYEGCSTEYLVSDTESDLPGKDSLVISDNCADATWSEELRPQLEEQVSTDDSSAGPNSLESEGSLMLEENESTEMISTEHELLRIEENGGNAVEALEGSIVGGSVVSEEDGRPEIDFPAVEPMSGEEESPIDEDGALEGSNERIQGKDFAVIGKDFSEKNSSLDPCPPVLSAVSSPVDPVTETVQTTFDVDEDVESSQQVIQEEERLLEKENEQQVSAGEISSPPTPHSPPVVSLAGNDDPCMEQGKRQGPLRIQNESGNFADVCEMCTSLPAEDLPKDGIPPEILVSDMVTRLPEQSYSTSPKSFQLPEHEEKGMRTDEEESFQECMSHDSNSLSISRSSLTNSSDQEAYSASTQGVGEEDQEETSQMQVLSSSGLDGGSQTRSHLEASLGSITEDQVTSSETVGLYIQAHEVSSYEDCKEQVVESKKAEQEDTVVPSSTHDSRKSFDQTTASDSIHSEADLLVEVGGRAGVENNVALHRQEHVPVPIGFVETEGNHVVQPVAGADVVQVASSENGLVTGDAEESFISLGESPACTDCSDMSKGDEGGSVDSPGTQSLMQNTGRRLSDVSADERGSSLPSRDPEIKLPLVDSDDLVSIDDNVWDEQSGEVKSIPSSSRSVEPTESIQPSELYHEKGGEQPCIRNRAVWGAPTRSLGQTEMTSAADFLDTRDSKENGHLACPSSNKEEVKNLRLQSQVSVSGSSLAETTSADTEELKLANGGASPSDCGIGGPSVLSDKMSSVGSQSARKLPISKAKSVRTHSHTPSSQFELTTEGRLSPDGAVPLSKSTVYTSVTVVSPESLQWEPSKSGVPASFRRNSDESSRAGNDLSKWSSQAVGSDNSPPLRRNLANTGQQESSSPTDTSREKSTYRSSKGHVKASEENGRILEGRSASKERSLSATKSPPKLKLPPGSQYKSMHSPGLTLGEVSPTKNNAAGKVPKAKCGCTIM
ncbi:hypothetical protein R1sor_004173 [Riccia sorocarpa]|uniref:Uncharacterized protein n=1 Tax=Riccia sorocarpa TaxID=122646 RepID=A0ABD3H5L8_9MARC